MSNTIVSNIFFKKLDVSQTYEVLNAARNIIADFDSMTDERAEEAFRSAAERLDVKLGAMLMPVRGAVTGTTASPPLFGSMRLLGTKKTIGRLDDAIAFVKEHVNG